MNRHLKGFICSVVVIVLCVFVTIATFAQGVWYGVFPLGLGIFFLIKFAIPSWREYKEENTPSKENPQISKGVFFAKCEEIIRSCEESQSLHSVSCSSDLMIYIINGVPKEAIFDDLEKQPRFLLMNTSARLLSSGQFHFYAGSLNPKGESLYRVFNHCAKWLLDNNYITQEE